MRRGQKHIAEALLQVSGQAYSLHGRTVLLSTKFSPSAATVFLGGGVGKPWGTKGWCSCRTLWPADLSTGRLDSEKLVSCVHRCILYQGRICIRSDGELG